MVALYIRQSADKKDSISIESQLAHCMAKLLPGEEYRIYEDRGFSGKNTDRPQFLAMMKDVEAGMIHKVVIYKLDRISRAILDFARMMDIFDRYQVSILSCSDPVDTTTPVGRAMLNVAMTFAQLERETIQQRVRDNYYERGRLGYYLGGRAPFGYRKIETALNGKKTCAFLPQKGQEGEARRIFLTYGTTDISLGKLARMLNGEGILPNSGCPWSGAALGRLLRNPVYVMADAEVYAYLKAKGAAMNNGVAEYMGERGCYVYARRKGVTSGKFSDLTASYVTLAPHKGMISPGLWLCCQRKLDRNQRLKNSGKGRLSFLSGLLECRLCGRAILVVKGGGGGRYLSCGGKKQKVCPGPKKGWRIEKIEAAVEEELLARARSIKTPAGKRRLPAGREANRLKAQLVAVEEKIENCLRRVGEGDPLVMDYINQSVAKLDAQKRGIRAKLERLGRTKAPDGEDFSDLPALLENWEAFSLEKKRKIAGILIEKVILAEGGILIFFR